MSFFDRIGRIFKSEKEADQPIAKERTLFDLNVGQIISLDLEDWVIEGRVVYHQQPGWVLYWISSGRQRQGLLLDRSAPGKAVVLTAFAGRVDDITEVKTEYVLDGNRYFLDYRGECLIDVFGTTPVGRGEIMFWQYETDQRAVYRIEWQNGRYFHYDGRWIDTFEVAVVAG